MWTLAVLCLVSIVGLSYLNRFQILPDLSVSPAGSLTFKSNSQLSNHINSYFESYHSSKSKRDYVCAHHLWAQDDRYAYVDLVCGMFERSETGEVEMLYGFRAPTRVELNVNGQVENFAQPVDGRHHESDKRRLFPKSVLKRSKELSTKQPWNNIHLLALQRMTTDL